MRDKIKKIIIVVCLVVLLAVSFRAVSYLVESKESDSRYSSFFTETADIDVLLFGTSHVKNGISPLELWDDCGIASYNLASDGNSLPVTYWTIVNALDYQMPKLIVVDMYDPISCYGRMYSPDWGMVHIALDAFPLSINKIKMVFDLFDDETAEEYNRRWELLLKIGEYHTRWSELKKLDFISRGETNINSRILKGFEPLINIVEREEHIYGTEDDLFYDEIAREYLERIIALCEERNIELLLINTGYDCSDKSKLFADSVDNLAAEHGINYVDFTDLDIINFNTDLATTDPNTHLNFSGAQRMTAYLGEYIMDNYDIADRRDDENYAQWLEDLENYKSYKHDKLEEQDYLPYYLMLLNDNDYKIIVEVKDTGVLDEQLTDDTLKNLGIDTSEIINGNNIVFADMQNLENISYLSYDDINSYSGEEWNTPIGALRMWYADENVYGIYLGLNDLYLVDEEEASQVYITILDAKTDEVVSVRGF